eukprot:s503_g16.t1
MFPCTSLQTRAMQPSENASSILIREPPSMQEVVEPVLTMLIQISKAEETLETLQTLCQSLPSSSASAKAYLNRPIDHLTMAVQMMHGDHDTALTLCGEELVQYSIQRISIDCLCLRLTSVAPVPNPAVHGTKTFRDQSDFPTEKEQRQLIALHGHRLGGIKV